MKYNSKTQALVDLIEPAIRACGVELWGIEFLPQGRRSLLRIYIDRPEPAAPGPAHSSGTDSTAETSLEVSAEASIVSETDTEAGQGIGVQDCVNVTHQVGAILDVHDPIAGEYTLEVSSPGWDRPFFSLGQMAGFIGQQVQLRLLSAIDGRRKWTGTLLRVVDQVELEAEGKTHLIPADQIDRANLIYQAG